MLRFLRVLPEVYGSGKRIRVPDSVQRSICSVRSNLMKRGIHSEVAEIRERVLKLSNNELNVGKFWKLTSFPIDPEFYRYTEEVQEKLEDISSDLGQVLKNRSETEYPDDVKELASGSPLPEPGTYFDVLSLMSSFGGGDLVRNNGDRVALSTDTFRGKYVMVCCFQVPVVRSVHETQELVNLCNELYSSRDDFEMVMVAKMSSLANDREIFDHFFSGFPKSCLTVPFEDSQRRDYICKVLELEGNRRHDYIGKKYNLDSRLYTWEYDSYHCRILSPEGKVLPCLGEHPKIDHYGAEAFPFTKELMYKSDMECREWVLNRASLERILRCNDSSPDFVYKINPSEKVSISQLSNEVKNKHVGLYLCTGGEFLPYLLKVYEQCRGKKLDFEIVVVCLPFDDAIDPKIFQEKIDSLLKRHHVCGNW